MLLHHGFHDHPHPMTLLSASHCTGNDFALSSRLRGPDLIITVTAVTFSPSVSLMVCLAHGSGEVGMEEADSVDRCLCT